VDSVKLRLAIIAAAHANSNDSYEHADIVPEVTGNVLDFFRLTNDMPNAQMCSNIVPIMKQNGITK
jgi:hypothetical protein